MSMDRNPQESYQGVNTPDNSIEAKKDRKRLPILSVGAIALAGTLVSGGVFVVAASAANSVKFEDNISGIDVKAVVDSVTVEIQPIVITQSLAETDTKVTSELKDDIVGLTWHRTWIKRAGLAEANYEFEPRSVSANYSSADDKVVITVPSTSITTRMEMVIDKTKTVDRGDAGFKFPLQVFEGIREAVNGFTKESSSENELLKGLVDSTLDVNETLEIIADLSAAKAVDEKCTDEIVKIPGFTDAFEDQVDILSKKEVLASDFLIGDEFNLSSEERYERINNAEVVFENNDTYTIGHDQEIADALKATLSELQTDNLQTDNTVSTASCAVDENTKFTVEEYEG